MGRPKTNTVEYFPHYSKNCRTLEILVTEYGNDGYCFFYRLLEILSNEDGHYYDCRKSIDFAYLSRKLGINPEKTGEILENMCDWGNLSKDLWECRIIWYQGFVDSLKEAYRSRKRPMPTIEDVIEKTKVYAQKQDLTLGITESYRVTTPESTQSKVKESKGKESIKPIMVESEELDPPKEPYKQNVINDKKPVKESVMVISDESDRDVDKIIVFKNDMGVEIDKQSGFEMLWSQYPKYRKVKKNVANGHYNQSVKNQVDFINICRALEGYLKKHEGTDPKFIQQGSTWFNNWRDNLESLDLPNSPDEKVTYEKSCEYFLSIYQIWPKDKRGIQSENLVLFLQCVDWRNGGVELFKDCFENYRLLLGKDESDDYAMSIKNFIPKHKNYMDVKNDI